MGEDSEEEDVSGADDDDQDDQDHYHGDDPVWAEPDGDEHGHDNTFEDGVPIDDVDMQQDVQSHDKEEDQESLWGDDAEIQDNQRRGKPWRFSPDEDISEEENNTISNIVDVDTDHEPHDSAEGSDGGDIIEEDLGAGPYNVLEDNISTKPILKVKVPENPDLIINKRKKPGRKAKKK